MAEGELDIDPEALDDFRDAIKRGIQSRPPRKVLDDIRKNFVKYPAEASGKMKEAMESTVDIAPAIGPDGKPNQTSYCQNYRQIFLSFHNVPRNMREIPDAVMAIFNGVSLHEVGHIIFTKEFADEWSKWMGRQRNSEIAHRVVNLIEDARINYRLSRMLRIQGPTLLNFDRLHSASWLNGIENMCKVTKAHYEKEGDSWSGKLPNRVLLSIAEVRGLFSHLLGGLPDKLMVDWFPHATKEQLEDIAKFEAILQKAKRFSNFNDQLKPAANALYDIESKYSTEDNKDRRKGPPEKPEKPEKPKDGEGPEGPEKPRERPGGPQQAYRCPHCGSKASPKPIKSSATQEMAVASGKKIRQFICPDCGELIDVEVDEGQDDGEGGKPGEGEEPEDEGEPGEGKEPGEGDEPGEDEEPGEEGKPTKQSDTPTDINDLDPTAWIPTFNGGKMDEPDAPESHLREWLEHDKATEEELERKKELNKERGKRGGVGSGKSVKPPDVNLSDFNERRSRLSKQITEMKDMLKFKTAPKMVTQKYQQRGRMMPGILARAALAAQRSPVQDIYQRRQFQYEENDVIMALLVDMSGSTDIETMKDSFVLLSEAASSWMPQENFSLWAFGDVFQRIKDFTEDYQHIKGRIGGMACLGGTMLGPPLGMIGKLFHEMRKRGGVKMMLVLSDFALGDPDDAIAYLDKMANEENIIPMLIANGGGDESVEGARQAARAAFQWCGGRYPIILMPRTVDLPRQFFKVYKLFADMNPKDIDSGRWREKVKGNLQAYGGGP